MFIKVQLFAEDEKNEEEKTSPAEQNNGVGDVIISLNQQLAEKDQLLAEKDKEIAELSKALKTIAITPSKPAKADSMDDKINKLFGE